jgi:SAM-dependent methyltransferase
MAYSDNVRTPTDPSYFYRSEVTRDFAEVTGDFWELDGIGLAKTALDTAKDLGSIAILEAGCGSGQALIGLKRFVVERTLLDPAQVTAVGIDLHDYTNYLNHSDKTKAEEGYIEIRHGDLSTMELKGSFDLSYALEVLIHCDQVTKVVSNVLNVLKPGGIFYCNTLPEQAIEMETIRRNLDRTGWATVAKEISRKTIAVKQSREFHKLVKPIE